MKYERTTKRRRLLHKRFYSHPRHSGADSRDLLFDIVKIEPGLGIDRALSYSSPVRSMGEVARDVSRVTEGAPSTAARSPSPALRTGEERQSATRPPRTIHKDSQCQRARCRSLRRADLLVKANCSATYRHRLIALCCRNGDKKRCGRGARAPTSLLMRGGQSGAVAQISPLGPKLCRIASVRKRSRRSAGASPASSYRQFGAVGSCGCLSGCSCA